MVCAFQTWLQFHWESCSASTMLLIIQNYCTYTWASGSGRDCCINHDHIIEQIWEGYIGLRHNSSSVFSAQFETHLHPCLNGYTYCTITVAGFKSFIFGLVKGSLVSAVSRLHQIVLSYIHIPGPRPCFDAILYYWSLEKLAACMSSSLCRDTCCTVALPHSACYHAALTSMSQA